MSDKRKRLMELAIEIEQIAIDYGNGIPQGPETWPRDALRYDLCSAVNVIRKTAKRLARPVALTPEEEIEKLRTELKERKGS